LLHQQDHLDDAQREQILQQLQDTPLLEDERLVRNSFEYDEARLTGHKKTAYELQKRGVERELIDGYLNEAEESGEIERCRQKAEQMIWGIRNRSHRETMSLLRQRLDSSGYESHAVTAALAEAQIGKDENRELESLKKEVEKAARRYSRKYGGRQLRSRIYEHALRKGYSRDDIAQALSELEVSDDENQ
ncbi:MAG: RecX family transcriptional regulator, partial [Erysipelotrichaceae bacterium]|nr:RecX family transcriptional regulator [Erysipelotrichaceae bacterium]